MMVHDLLRGAACVLLALACGCDRGAPTISEIEARERSSRMYANAMDDLQAGRMDAAIRGFERVVLDEPKSYSAHFQLATLLQDVRKDYVGAIAHYRAYLALRPASDKATVAEDRVKLCDTLLSTEYVRKASGSATDRLASDNEKLVAERNRLTVQVKNLTTELETAKKEVARLTEENNMRCRLLAKLSSEDDGGAPGRAKTLSAKEALAELREMEAEEKRRRIRPTDAELLDEDDSGDRLRDSPDVKKLLADAKREEEADRSDPLARKPPEKSAPAAAAGGRKGGGGAFDALLAQTGKKKPGSAAGRPETYVVQPGDTLFKISTRFYGSNAMWRKIRELNMTLIPPDGRVRVGQTIRLP